MLVPAYYTGSPIAVKSHRLALLAIIFVAALLTGCRAGDTRPIRRVFLITVDTLRADHLGMHGYARATSPYIDRLAAESVVFDMAIAQWPKTGPSFASMFTGQYPLTTGLTHHAAIRVPEAYLTLPEFLHNQGFATVAVNSNGILNTDLGWQAGFDEYLETRTHFPAAGDSQQDYRDTMNAQRVNELALPLLARHAGDRRLFAWIHYSDPHAPYLLPRGVQNPFLDDGRYTDQRQVAFGSPAAPEAAPIAGRTELGFYVAQYDANVLVVDRAIEQLLQDLERRGLLEDALVLFTADHGESLGEHDYYLAHGRLPYNTTARVPLVWWGQGVGSARRIEGAVELVDIYPTLRDLLAPGFAIAGLEGESLAPLLRGAPAPAGADGVRYAYSQAGGGSPLTHWRTVQDQRLKLVYHPELPTRNGSQPPRIEFYDLRSDPLESRNLARQGAAEPPELRRLHAALRQWMGDREWIAPPRGLAQQHSQETLEALRALGYIGN
jgi:arylsulfatase A-like enzyme